MPYHLFDNPRPIAKWTPLFPGVPRAVLVESLRAAVREGVFRDPDTELEARLVPFRGTRDAG